MAADPFKNLLLDEHIRLVSYLAGSFGIQSYLVGGSLRDAIMGRPVRDYDFALGGAVWELSREFAARSGGTFFWLDRERQQSRVVTGREGERLTFDFAPLRGGTIEEDLCLRDFSVNALALSLIRREERLLDPLGGMDDIRTGIVRMCRREAFTDDPLRLLRAFRFAATLGFFVEVGTLEAIKRGPDMLSQVAGERIRDEFFLILGATGIGTSLKNLLHAGLLDIIIPSDAIKGGAHPGPEARITFAADVERLAMELDRHFTEDWPLLGDRLQRPLEGDIPVLSLVKLAALLAGDDPDSLIQSAVMRLRLGSRSREELRTLCGCHSGFPALTGEIFAERPCYRFFRDREPAGPELLILPLASGLFSPQLAGQMLSFYFHRYRPGEGDLLLNGDEVMALLRIPQGLELGRQMELLREAESLGLVATAGEAREFLLKKHPFRTETS